MGCAWDGGGEGGYEEEGLVGVLMRGGLREKGLWWYYCGVAGWE